MITIRDLDVFILTKNRPHFLSEAIQSLLAQTICPDRITILDNSDDNETFKLVQKVNSTDLIHCRTSGKFGNYLKAKELTDRKYVLLFHDDDILNQRYLELAIAAINQYKNISLVCSNYTAFEDGVSLNVGDMKSTHFLLRNKKQFAKHMYLAERIAFASAIYAANNFIMGITHYQRFGKWNDWPFLVEAIDSGSAVLFNDPVSLFSRVHEGNDSVTNFNTVNLSQIVNWDQYFLQYLTPKSKFVKYLYAQRATRFALGKCSTIEDVLPVHLKIEFEKRGLIFVSNQNDFEYYDRFFYSYFITRYLKINYVAFIGCKFTLFDANIRQIYFNLSLWRQIVLYRIKKNFSRV